MKIFIIALAVGVAPLVLCYDEAYDKVDVEKILSDDKLFQSYINCLLDKGPCDLENSADYKKLLPEVIATNCAKCTPIQKRYVKTVFKAIAEKKPEEFKDFVLKYDPNHEHEQAFTAFLATVE